MVPLCLFFGESERKKQKKMIQKFVWKIKKNVRIHDDDFFSEKMRLFVQKKKNIIAFWMTALLAWVQGEGTNH